MSELTTHQPSDVFVKQATVSGMAAYQALCKKAEADYEGFWAEQARRLISWKTPFTKILNQSDAPFFKWFEDGTLNASYNCLDRNIEKGHGNKTALIFEADGGEVTKITYNQLLAKTCQMANALKSIGVKKGDRVMIYISMSIDGVAAMQACARIGATHSVVFGGFSAQSLRDRIEDTGAVAVITADQQVRGGKHLPLKAIVDEAIALGGCATIKNVLVVKRTGSDIAMQAGRDQWMHELCDKQATTCEPEWVGAEHPLFLLYTSGSTGKPKGVQHSTGGYLLHAALTTEWTFDLKDNDVFWCTADIGWVTGHTYSTYGHIQPRALQGRIVVGHKHLAAGALGHLRRCAHRLQLARRHGKVAQRVCSRFVANRRWLRNGCRSRLNGRLVGRLAAAQGGQRGHHRPGCGRESKAKTTELHRYPSLQDKRS